MLVLVNNQFSSLFGQLLFAVVTQDTISSLSRDGISFWLNGQDTEKMLGDQFGLRKIIVMATENGKVST